ncbi:hypothetical protein BD289DRAFT_431319 [Coniella lustricola]|uniref:Uncharacterized protein n=1 Tax=Coniella lustricola TaxID=2025994 RepID=A0A2T3AAY2_9PEZI|nr:hypothetical protein BD289DRAFT_431319 [Coniella lustricola]
MLSMAEKSAIAITILILAISSTTAAAAAETLPTLLPKEQPEGKADISGWLRRSRFDLLKLWRHSQLFKPGSQHNGSVIVFDGTDEQRNGQAMLQKCRSCGGCEPLLSQTGSPRP